MCRADALRIITRFLGIGLYPGRLEKIGVRLRPFGRHLADVRHPFGIHIGVLFFNFRDGEIEERSDRGDDLIFASASSQFGGPQGHADELIADRERFTVAIINVAACGAGGKESDGRMGRERGEKIRRRPEYAPAVELPPQRELIRFAKCSQRGGLEFDVEFRQRGVALFDCRAECGFNCLEACFSRPIPVAFDKIVLRDLCLRGRGEHRIHRREITLFPRAKEIARSRIGRRARRGQIERRRRRRDDDFTARLKERGEAASADELQELAPREPGPARNHSAIIAHPVSGEPTSVGRSRLTDHFPFVIFALAQTMQSIHLDSRQPTPLYLQLINAIRDQIARGDLRPGDELPTVRELAAALHVNQNTIARAYGHLHHEGLVDARARQGTRVATPPRGEHLRATRDAELRLWVSRLIGEGLAHGFTLAEIEAAFVGQRARWHAEQSVAPIPARLPQQILGFGSHDLSLELFLTHFHETHPDVHMTFAAVGSLAGLMTLARGEAHFAAAHIYDPARGDYNAPFARRLMPGRALTLITLAERAQGLMLAKGNPKKIRSVNDLKRRGIRFVNRQRGSGTRVLLDELLKKARLAQRAIRGYTSEEETHLGVAAAIASGIADVGLGIQAAARTFDLDFVPLAQERYEIILPRDDALIEPLLEILARPEFRQAVQALGGYDVKEMGRVRSV